MASRTVALQADYDGQNAESYQRDDFERTKGISGHRRGPSMQGTGSTHSSS